MPAEWEPHEATWIAWPHNADDWPGKFQAIPWVYAEIVRQLSARREGPHPRRRRARREARRAHADPRRRRPASCALPPLAHRPRLDARLRPDLRQETAAKARSAVTNWKFNAWAKYDELAARRPGPPPRRRAPQTASMETARQHRRPSIASSSKAAASTSTAPACCSPPKNACSAKSSSATPA